MFSVVARALALLGVLGVYLVARVNFAACSVWLLYCRALLV